MRHNGKQGLSVGPKLMGEKVGVIKMLTISRHLSNWMFILGPLRYWKTAKTSKMWIQWPLPLCIDMYPNLVFPRRKCKYVHSSHYYLLLSQRSKDDKDVLKSLTLVFTMLCIQPSLSASLHDILMDENTEKCIMGFILFFL